MKNKGKHYSDRTNEENIIHMPTPFRLNLEHFDYRKAAPAITLRHALLHMLVLIILRPYFLLVNGYHVHGRKNLRRLGDGGFVTISNHIHIMDAPMTGCAIGMRRVYFLTLASNFCIPVIRHLVTALDGVPLTKEPEQVDTLFREMEKALQNGDIVHVYPEGVLVPYCDHLRTFRRGAFKMAAEADVPVLPMVYTYRKPKGLLRLFRKKPYLLCTFLSPVYPDHSVPLRERSIRLMKQCRAEMLSAMLPERS